MNIKNNDILSTYHFSTPVTKCFYPDSFVASASFMHYDLWFSHILIYQYWLWFVFVFLITFFFLMLIHILRWCNFRTRPRRETRGVSRSKCADLITACVPVSWATSIIVSESTDAIDYFDGFGTTETIVGIRAYQWGWEYYYPKDLDLQYSMVENYSTFLGNSLHYSTTSSTNNGTTYVWNFFRTSQTNQHSTPLSLLFYFNKNNTPLNLFSKSNSTIDFFNEYNAFKFVTTFSRLLNREQPLWTPLNLANYNDINPLESSLYGLERQYNLISSKAVLNQNETLFNTTPPHSQVDFTNKPETLTNTNLSEKSNSFLDFKKKIKDQYNQPSFLNLSTREDLILASIRTNSYRLAEEQLRLNLNNIDGLPNIVNNLLTPNNHLFTATFADNFSIHDSKHLPTQINLNYDEITQSNYFRLVANNTINTNNTQYNYDFKNNQYLLFLENNIWDSIIMSEEIGIVKQSEYDKQFNKTELATNNNLLPTRNKLFNTVTTNSSKIKTPLTIDFVPNNTFTDHTKTTNRVYQGVIDSWNLPNPDDSYSTSKSSLTDKSVNYVTLADINNVRDLKWSLNFFRDDLESSDIVNELSEPFTQTTKQVQQLNQRKHGRNASINYNSIQKVFRSRFDEGRSNTNVSDLSSIKSSLPIFTTKKTPYESLLGKTANYIMEVQFFTPKLNTITVDSVFAPTNSTFFNFPFLVSYKSDASRYMWFDWYSKWKLCEIQPSSQSKYGLFGAPHFNRGFEYNTTKNDIYSDSETYFSRLSKVRQNSSHTTNNTPYVQYLNNANNASHPQTIAGLYDTLNFSFDEKNTSATFTNFNSNTNIYGKTFHNNIGIYATIDSELGDILTKRDYLINHILQNNDTSYSFVKSSDIRSELLSIFSNNTPNFDNYKSIILNLNLFNAINRYLLDGTVVDQFDPLLKNQYQPSRKGISNMIRLHATGAIALPIETRLQVLASSKDVIHSWAVPSAGIKIDCVPGYSSHKVVIFLLSGIYWGQCMEICGRYHHWMPIIVYFMKRDLFFLWCTHFVLSNDSLSEVARRENLTISELPTVWFSEL